MGAEKNHLWPLIRYSSPQAPLPAATAVVVLVRKSLPPCFSVMPMPMVSAGLSRKTTSRASYSLQASLDSSCAQSGAFFLSRGMLALVIVLGQVEPASTWQCM